MNKKSLQLPIEINNCILEFAGIIKLRNGKYMKQIPKDDKRYNILRTIPLKNGGPCMIYSQMCHMWWVCNNNGERFILYYENHPNYTSGEIQIQYVINESNHTHIIGNKYPPLWLPSRFTSKRYTSTKIWIDYESDDD